MKHINDKEFITHYFNEIKAQRPALTNREVAEQIATIAIHQLDKSRASRIKKKLEKKYGHLNTHRHKLTLIEPIENDGEIDHCPETGQLIYTNHILPNDEIMEMSDEKRQILYHASQQRLAELHQSLTIPKTEIEKMLRITIEMTATLQQLKQLFEIDTMTKAMAEIGIGPQWAIDKYFKGLPPSK